MTLGRVKASAKKIMSGCWPLICPMTHSQKWKGLVWGLSTRNIRTPCSIQKVKTLSSSSHRLCQAAVSKLNG